MHIDEAWQNGTLRTLTENSGKDDYGQILAPRSDKQRGWQVWASRSKQAAESEPQGLSSPVSGRTTEKTGETSGVR